MKSLRVTVETIEVTADGTFGGPVDVCRRFIPGLRHYWLTEDGVEREISEAECRELSSQRHVAA